MNDEPVDYSKEEALRYRMETSKEKSILIRNWIYTVISVIVAVMLVWGLWSWRNANNMASAAQARLLAIADRLDSKLDTIDTSKLNTIADGGAATLQAARERIDALRATQAELDRSIIALRSSTNVLTSSVAARLQTLDGVLVSLRGVGDETRRQIGQNGDAATKAINGLTDVEGKLGVEVTHMGTVAQTQSDELAKLIKAATSRVEDKRIDDFMATLPGTGGNVEKITANLAGITGNLKTASDQAPQIALLWRKAMETNNRFQKYLIIARILGLVGPVFSPLIP
jgi:hypothetical protein